MKNLSPAFRPTLAVSAAAILALSALLISACSKQAAKEAAPAEAKPAAVAQPPANPLGTLDQKISYGVGFNIGSTVARDGVVTIDAEALKQGLADAAASAKPRLSETELQAAFMELQQKIQVAGAAKAEKLAAAAVEFLAKNKLRPEVKTTASGLQYEVLTSGTGAKPKPTDTVEVHYHGTLLDGTVFDSSVERGKTIEFPVTGVIKGWIEALQLMSVGDKWKLYVPAELGYGPRANGKIPANALLIFEVQLIAIK